jgi:uncharacterized membrane protein YdjX (TVP38/TMEM64 family)
LKNFVFPLILLAMILVPFFLFGERADEFLENLLRFRQYGLISGLLLSGLLAADILLPIPSSLVSTTCGYWLGPVSGMLASWTGMMIACLAGYWIGHRSSGLISSQQPAGSDKIKGLFERHGDWAIILSRAVPVLEESSVVYAGYSGMHRGRFLGLAAVSNLAVSAVYVLSGYYAAGENGFYVAFAASVLLPLALKLLIRCFRRPAELVTRETRSGNNP